MRILITGGFGLVGSSCIEYFYRSGVSILAIDNDERSRFFGSAGSIARVRTQVLNRFPGVKSQDLDIRDRNGLMACVNEFAPELVIHCAAQPSHDFAAQIPEADFAINAVGTLNLLEAVRLSAPTATLAFISTNKVYGDLPNRIRLHEEESRWSIIDPEYPNGISERMSIDQSTHSLYGVSKTSADLLVQEYGRYFGLNTVSFRAGCVTGANHAGVELHGFLSYMVKTLVSGKSYVIHGYKGKQVRDQIHASDVAAAIDCFHRNPKKGSVYNLGGGYENSISIIEAIAAIEEKAGVKANVVYSDVPRKADHICYYTDLSRFKADFPEWKLKRNLNDIFEDLLQEPPRSIPKQSEKSSVPGRLKEIEETKPSAFK